MIEINFKSMLKEIEPIVVPAYLDQHSSRPYFFNSHKMKAGDYAIEIDGSYYYSGYGGLAGSIILNVLDSEGNYIDINQKQYKKLKITVLNNIVPNGKEYSKPI